jgi:hypothetical protein
MDAINWFVEIHIFLFIFNTQRFIDFIGYFVSPVNIAESPVKVMAYIFESMTHESLDKRREALEESAQSGVLELSNEGSIDCQLIKNRIRKSQALMKGIQSCVDSVDKRLWQKFSSMTHFERENILYVKDECLNSLHREGGWAARREALNRVYAEELTEQKKLTVALMESESLQVWIKSEFDNRTKPIDASKTHRKNVVRN